MVTTLPELSEVVVTIPITTRKRNEVLTGLGHSKNSRTTGESHWEGEGRRYFTHNNRWAELASKSLNIRGKTDLMDVSPVTVTGMVRSNTCQVTETKAITATCQPASINHFKDNFNFIHKS